ncbi:MAG: DUF2207 domain-containing protein [Microbacterium sp.]|uniref:DUF2207 domain-containing protein n=1 Tax=Microbacterium sp. TaxID=51671 RepID=UPI00260B2740|nr:DUF2207 domain-containing protein [Microbacterium sp.]MCX6502237.1 DUF2207 domain-containing protein [Microbacterium sp.]
MWRRKAKTPKPEDAPETERFPDERPRPTPLWALLSRWLLGAEAWLRSHGGKRLRLGIRGFWGVIAAGGLFLLFGPVINPPLTLDDITSSASTATDHWIVRHMDADYRLARDDDGGLRVHVEERIEALFPDDVDQSGIQRVLAVEYQGHALAPSTITATLDGEPIEVTRSATPETLTLTLDAGERLDGDHVFALSYTLQDLAYRTTDAATGADVDLLEWDVFGPSWPQGMAGLDVSVTLPDDLDAELVRPPRGMLGWSILTAGEWLTPETDSPPGTVTYAFSNDQNLPPHAQAQFSMPFAAGTFAMPPLTPLFWVQTLGPLAPLVFLAVTLLFVLAARAVAWSDARGRPWFVAQYDPPPGVTPRLAAQVLQTPRTMELAGALRWAAHGTRAAKLAAARVAHRTGRFGDRLPARLRYLSAAERREQYTRGLRRIPRGFVRDFFIAAPIALTVLQWGLVRQLSHQAPLAIVWWPTAFVLASTVVALAVLGITRTARPLTRRGALLTQHLRGIQVYAERTELLARAESDDRLLPFAVLTAAPRDAGRRVRETLAHELGDPRAGRRGWRTGGFVTWPTMVVSGAAVLTVLAAIAVVVFLPNPYERHPEYATQYGDVPGTLYTVFQSEQVTGELTRSPSGAAELAVTEQLNVVFSDESSRVPQVAKQWPDRIRGHDLQFRVERVSIDGAEVPFTVERDGDTQLMLTTMNDVLTGAHTVEIRYVLGSAAYADQAADGRLVDRVRWAALWEDWQSFSEWAEEPIDPVRVEFRLSDELADLAEDAGWLTQDTSADEVRDWNETVVPFGHVARLVDPGDGTDPDDETSESAGAVAGFDTHVLELRRGEGGYPFDLTVTDTGVRVDFPAGTFAGPSATERGLAETRAALPIAVALLWGCLAALWGVAGLLLRAAGSSALTARGAVRVLIRWAPAACALAATIVMFWVSGGMDGDDPTFFWFAGAAGAAVLGAIAGWCTTRRRAAKR